MHVTCYQNGREGHRGSRGRCYGHQPLTSPFGSTHRFLFRVTGPRHNAALLVAAYGARACVEPRRSKRSAGLWARYSSRHAVTCYTIVCLRYSERPTYLIHFGPTYRCLPIQPSESLGQVTDRSSTVNGVRKTCRSFMGAAVVLGRRCRPWGGADKPRASTTEVARCPGDRHPLFDGFPLAQGAVRCIAIFLTPHADPKGGCRRPLRLLPYG
jgi:hypothetical protein